MSNFRILDQRGPNCHRCGRPLQIRRRIGEAKPWQFNIWYYCDNKRCKTTTVLPDDNPLQPVQNKPKTQYEEWKLKQAERRLERDAQRRRRERKVGFGPSVGLPAQTEERPPWED